jgi:hypothetical protein
LIGIGWILDRSDDQVHQLEENNKRWWEELGEDSRLADFFVKHWDALYRYDFDWACWFVLS